MSRRNYIHIAISLETYMLLREIMDTLIMMHGGKRLLSGRRLTQDLVIRDALEMYREFLKRGEHEG